MTSRCSSDMPAIRVHRREEGAGSARCGPCGKLIKQERFTELPYANPVLIIIKDTGKIHEWQLKHFLKEKK